MKITFDPVKRAVTLAERGLDFEDPAEVFRADTLDFPDERRDYANFACLRLAIFADAIWTPRGSARHVISMRKANAREKARFGKRFEEG
jgi:uncharacterized protein